MYITGDPEGIPYSVFTEKLSYSPECNSAYEKMQGSLSLLFAEAENNIYAMNRIALPCRRQTSGTHYFLNQEEYPRAFLKDAEIPIDNNNTESTIRGFTVGCKNWMMINTVSDANDSAVIYSLVETSRANNLHIYHYFEYLLEELPKLKVFTSAEEESQSIP